MKRESAKMSVEELADVDNHQLISYTQHWIGQSIVMRNNGSPAERQNLLGQLRAGILKCIDLGVLNEVLEKFPAHIQDKVKLDYNYKG